jgi:hypothetical protein
VGNVSRSGRKRHWHRTKFISSDRVRVSLKISRNYPAQSCAFPVPKVEVSVTRPYRAYREVEIKVISVRVAGIKDEK